jgi:hypothetical protein
MLTYDIHTRSSIQAIESRLGIFSLAARRLESVLEVGWLHRGLCQSKIEGEQHALFSHTC